MRATIILFVVVALVTVAQAGPVRLLDPKSLAPRIVGGVVVNPPYKYPFMAALNPVLSDGTILLCGGSLIAPDWILTAAHCSVDAVASRSIVALHRQDISQDTTDVGPIVRGVNKIVVNPNYDPKNVVFDYAMWQLDSPVTTLTPIALDDGTHYQPGTTCTTMGWGDTSDGGTPSDLLREVDLSVVDPVVCENIIGTLNTVVQLCAWYEPGGKDSCQGDSGGPLLVNKTGTPVLIGLVSFGDGCAKPESPGVYSRVAGQRDWFTAVMNSGAVLSPSIFAVVSLVFFSISRCL